MTRSAADHWERGLALFETRLAATIRDYMRARDAGDQFAVKFGAEHICQGLGYLLNRFLEVADGWDSRERWIDGMVGARVEVIASDRIHVAGPMVWGLRADVGGEQWAEPLEAELTIGWEISDLKQYHLHFGDRRELDAKRVTPGLYDTVAGLDELPKGGMLHGPISFRPLLGESEDRKGFPYPPEPASPTWLYEFRKPISAAPPPNSGR